MRHGIRFSGSRRTHSLGRIAVLHMTVGRRRSRRVPHDLHRLFACTRRLVVLHLDHWLRAKARLKRCRLSDRSWGSGLADSKLGPGQVEARREGHGGTTVLRTPDLHFSQRAIPDCVTYRPPRVSPPMKGTSHNTSISFDPRPTTTPFMASGTPPAAAATTMITRSPRAKVCPCKR